MTQPKPQPDLRQMHVMAEGYMERGWPIIPIPPINGRPVKAPTEKRWPENLLEPGCAQDVLRAGWNIGLLLRELQDVDLDCREARAAAPVFLPATGLIYGHAASPESHRLYRATTPLQYRKFALGNDDERGDLLELRAMLPASNGSESKAFQSVLPPSIHPSGEQYEWSRYDEAAEVDGAALWRAVHLVAICAALAKLHPGFDDKHKSARDEYRLAISGVLARRLPEAEALKVFTNALKIAGDRKDRQSIFKTTAQKLRAGSDKVKGIPAFKQIVGDAATAVLNWIECIAEQPKPRVAATLEREPGDESEVKIAEPQEMPILDMPEQVLCGRLGEICRDRMKRFPISYSWPALVSAAGVLAHQNSTLRSNLNVALCGPVGTGKSAAVEHAHDSLGLGAPEIVTTMAGSVEGLLAKIQDAKGCARLYFPDELGHLFAKAQIEHSTFCHVLNSAFYKTAFDLTVAGRKVIPFNCSLGVAGGIVLDDPNGGDNFEECFNSITTMGTYDRFIFGRCARPFTYYYRPFEGNAEALGNAANVGVEPAVWEMRDEWIKTIPGMTGRVAEIALRVASICAGVDGVTLLKAESEYVKSALAFAEYQIRFRDVMRPNPGKNDDAKCAHAILRKLDELAPSGQWIDKRSIYRAIHASRFGPGIFYRAGNYLIMNGDIERQLVAGTTKKMEVWRKS